MPALRRLGAGPCWRSLQREVRDGFRTCQTAPSGSLPVKQKEVEGWVQRLVKSQERKKRPGEGRVVYLDVTDLHLRPEDVKATHPCSVLGCLAQQCCCEARETSLMERCASPK